MSWFSDRPDGDVWVLWSYSFPCEGVGCLEFLISISISISISSSLALEVEKSLWDRDFCEFLWSGGFKEILCAKKVLSTDNEEGK
ncbi:hypothetical protein DsansV1_C04g0036961 [Dioscorea sansibarensis]